MTLDRELIIDFNKSITTENTGTPPFFGRFETHRKDFVIIHVIFLRFHIEIDEMTRYKYNKFRGSRIQLYCGFQSHLRDNLT